MIEGKIVLPAFGNKELSLLCKDEILKFSDGREIAQNNLKQITINNKKETILFEFISDSLLVSFSISENDFFLQVKKFLVLNFKDIKIKSYSGKRKSKGSENINPNLKIVKGVVIPLLLMLLTIALISFYYKIKKNNDTAYFVPQDSSESYVSNENNISNYKSEKGGKADKIFRTEVRSLPDVEIKNYSDGNEKIAENRNIAIYEEKNQNLFVDSILNQIGFTKSDLTENLNSVEKANSFILNCYNSLSDQLGFEKCPDINTFINSLLIQISYNEIESGDLILVDNIHLGVIVNFIDYNTYDLVYNNIADRKIVKKKCMDLSSYWKNDNSGDKSYRKRLKYLRINQDFWM
ncbi:MAG: hypothetical protein JXR48_10220 [Candidatus Delongbacteria bacterium]|nr:hypothetical protein [Candidatus Delongbacteria bacterium]MBN2835330.1 hypothetical protein [Candidatus Delongbacteria bacterium]